MEIKRKIRKEMRNMRNGISNDEVLYMSMCICKKLSKLKPEAEYENILLYSAINNETDLTEYYRYLKENNKKIFFSKGIRGHNGILSGYRVRRNEKGLIFYNGTCGRRE